MSGAIGGTQIQLSLLSKSPPTVPGWDFAAILPSGRVMEATFYDFFDLQENERMGIIIADVADKGAIGAVHGVEPNCHPHYSLHGTQSGQRPHAASDLILNDSQSDLFLSAITGNSTLTQGD